MGTLTVKPECCRLESMVDGQPAGLAQGGGGEGGGKGEGGGCGGGSGGGGRDGGPDTKGGRGAPQARRADLPAAADPDMPAADAEPACWVCLEGTEAGGLLPQGCACRGTSGLAHVACIASAAQNQATPELVNTWWYACPTCKQGYCGAMQLELARARWVLTSGLPEADADRLSAMTRLAESLQASGDFAAARPLLEDLVTIGRRAYGSLDHAVLHSFGELGKVLSETRDFAAALPLLEECVDGLRRECGENHMDTLYYQGCLATLHGRMGKLAVCRSMKEAVLQTLRETSPGDHHIIEKTQNLGNSLVACGDMHGGMLLMEEAATTARQVLGPAHLLTQSVTRARDRALSDAKAIGLPPSCHGAGRLVGLASKPELNFSKVYIVGFDAAKGRYQVTFATTDPNYTERPMGIKPANIVLLDSSAVIVEGLQGATEWNGRRGLVESFNEDSGRCASFALHCRFCRSFQSAHRSVGIPTDLLLQIE